MRWYNYNGVCAGGCGYTDGMGYEMRWCEMRRRRRLSDADRLIGRQTDRRDEIEKVDDDIGSRPEGMVWS